MKQFMDQKTLENSYEEVLNVLKNTGVIFEKESIREFFLTKGAKVEENRVFIPQNLVEEAFASTPKQEYRHTEKKRVVAATPFSNAPFVLDDETNKIRRCTIDDAIKMYQVSETSKLYECANPGCADPVDINSEDSFIAQVAMMLKYSEKYPSIGLRATKSNSKNEDVYGSAKKAFHMVREFYDTWDEPVMTQGVCPNPPLAYDKESLDNLQAAIDEKQAISIFPCSLSYMTGPETIMGLVLHDFAMCLAGLTYVQLISPGHDVALCEFSTMTDIKTLQPAYGSPECVFAQVMFYELAKFLKIPCTICGSYGDGIEVNYQGGIESMLTILAPFQLTEVAEVWCYPGILSGFSCASFIKAILDEEAMVYANRVLGGTNLGIPENFSQYLREGQDNGGFLSIGSLEKYRRDHYITGVFNKGGIANKDQKLDLNDVAKKVLNSRIKGYKLPQRTKEQMKILAPYLPAQCK